MAQKNKSVVECCAADKEEEFSALLSKLNQMLKRSGLKSTQQREVILRLLLDHPGHHTPEQIHNLLKDKYPTHKIGIATVYRTLSLLEKETIVSSVSFGVSGKKYELAYSHHHDHMICVKCDKIIEFYDQRLEEIQAEIATKYDFAMNDHLMQIFGVCAECASQASRGIQ